MFLGKLFSFKKKRDALVVLLAARNPRGDVLEVLSGAAVTLREAFTSRGIIQGLPEAGLVILDEVIPLADASLDLVHRTLELAGIPVCSADEFMRQPDEWLGRARLAGARPISFLPARQVNMINWSGGVGKTTLAMAVCKRFVERSGLPAALLELSMGGSALHARVAENLPDFYAIATGAAEPAAWHGVHLYPLDGRTTDVLMGDDPARVRQVLADIRQTHTLLVVDGFPGHPLYRELAGIRPDLFNLIISSPRDDALLRSKSLLNEITGSLLVLNMCRTAADRLEWAAVKLPYREDWAQSCDRRLAEPVLNLVYTGWDRRDR